MKNGKRPTREERRIMEEWKLNSMNWLVTKHTSEFMDLVHRHNDEVTRRIPLT